MLYYSPSSEQKKTASLLGQKLRNVALILQAGHEHLKSFSSIIHDRKSQQMVYTLFTEIHQYYLELINQIQSLEGKPFDVDAENHRKDIFNLNELGKNPAIKDLIVECGKIEAPILKSYRELLNSHFVTGDMRTFLQHQYNGFLYSFVKLKMLDSLNLTMRKTGVRF